MGASYSREGDLEQSDSEDEGLSSSPSPSASSQSFRSPERSPATAASRGHGLEAKLGALSLHRKGSLPPPSHTVKLYRHTGGTSPRARWSLEDRTAAWEFVRDDDDSSGDEEEGGARSRTGFSAWLLLVGSKVRAKVDSKLQMKFFDDQIRADFVHLGVWAVKFSGHGDFKDFTSEYHSCLFENTYLLEATDENKAKVFGKDFMGWAKPEEADDSIWEDAESAFEKLAAPRRELQEAYMESITGGIQSLTMGALDHSFLVSDKGIQAVKNLASGLHGKGVAVALGNAVGGDAYSTPKKALLMKRESDMMVLSPFKDDKHATGVHQLDIQSGKVVAQWKFEKDGTPITMRDLTNESKSAQLDPSGSTFLGLDDNRLCRWDTRVRHGIVQDLASPVLDWKEGHQFSRGTNFQCFAAAGDGAVVVGSKDGKVRLYGTTSMRMAKTAFPGLGSPITYVDVTYDGLWVLATTDTYLILISTAFKDKDGKMKTGFTGRMGNKIAAPRMLKLTPLDAYLAGKSYKFQGGQFSWVTESGRQERHLVASVGNFTVLWNFRRVKDSNHECYKHTEGLKTCYCYKIVPKDESIVASKFMHDNYTSNSPEAPLVVATPKNVSSFNIWRE